MGGVIPTISHYVRIAPDEPLPDLNVWAPFKAIVVLTTDYPAEWQSEVSNWLVESGCRYMMAWGQDCSSWDNSVDHADMIRFPDYEIPDDKFVMTSWHDNETLEDVFWFSQFCAIFSYDEVELTNAVILHVSKKSREADLLTLFEQSKTLAEREPDLG